MKVNNLFGTEQDSSRYFKDMFQGKKDWEYWCVRHSIFNSYTAEYGTNLVNYYEALKEYEKIKDRDLDEVLDILSNKIMGTNNVIHSMNAFKINGDVVDHGGKKLFFDGAYFSHRLPDPAPFKFGTVEKLVLTNIQDCREIPAWFPTEIKRTFFISGSKMSFHNFHKAIKKSAEIDCYNTKITDSALGIVVSDVSDISFDSVYPEMLKFERVIERYLKFDKMHTDIFECQQKLIDMGGIFEKLAQL